jgi:hypothetical protein
MFISQQHNRWPRTLPRIAARLRQVLDLPELTMSTRRDYLAISWIGGPPAEPVYAELRRRLGDVAHPFLTLPLFIAMFERDHGPLEYQRAYGKAMEHITMPYPDIAT